MLRTLASGLLILSFFVSLSGADTDFARCNCDDEGFWSIESIMYCQKASDFLIAIAYFSIPIELLYFVSCSSFPFKWVLFQFIAFIVLCGMTHFLNVWTHYGQHSFQLMLAFTIFKVLTALVSFATAITLITLIPLLLKVKVREFMLKKKTWDLGREVGKIKRQKEAGWLVRMLTQEIRKSLDRRTILETTQVELSKTLDLHNCAIWMPNEDNTEMNLTHEPRGRNYSNMYSSPIPTSDPDVKEITGSDEVKILKADSPLAAASSGGSSEPGAVAAVRIQMLRVSNFNGGTPELLPACYAILVLVLPSGKGRCWSNQEIEIVKAVADQVAVALFHASVLEESQNMRETLEEQNRALQQAKQDALRASQARNASQMVMSQGLRRPMHSILGLLSMLQDDNLGNEQRLLVDTMVKTSNVLSTLINDVMDTSTKDDGRFPLELRHFQLHSMIKEAACLAKCLCTYRDYSITVEVDKSLPNHVMGDERRVFQVILHMVGNILKGSNGGHLTLRVLPESATGEGNDVGRRRRSNSSLDYAYIWFEVGTSNNHSQSEGKASSLPHYSQRYCTNEIKEILSFTVCKKLVQLMQGDILVVPNAEGVEQIRAVVLVFPLRHSFSRGIPENGESPDHSHSHSLLRGVKVLLADYDDVNRAVTRKLLGKLGCIVSAVSSGYDCLGALGPAVPSFQIVLLDLHLPDLDGFEVTMRIRKFRSRSWPLIIGLAATADEEVSGRCHQIGMNGIVHKPILLTGIADELQRVLLQASRMMS